MNNRKVCMGGACTSYPHYVVSQFRRMAPTHMIKAGIRVTIPSGENPSIGFRLICRAK
jgi:hypothetical protein